MAARSFVRPSSAARALSRAASHPSTPLPRTVIAAPRASAPASMSLYQASLSSRKLFHSVPSRRKGDVPPAHPPPTDFSELDVLGNTPIPSTSVDVCLYDGFGLNSGLTITDGNGVLLVDGEVFNWRPWEAKGQMVLANKKGQLDLPAETFALFDLIWPRPDLLIIGTGPTIMPLSPETRRYISELGIRVEVIDTRNAAAQFNLLATERGVSDVAAALVPVGWKEGVGAK